MNEILWTDAFGDGATWLAYSFEYNNRDVSREAARERAGDQQKISQAIRDEVDACLAGSKSMYVKLTAGRLAGTIAKVVQLPRFFLNIENNRLKSERDPGFVEIVHEDDGWRKRWRLRGSYYLAANKFQPKVCDFQMIQCEVDDKVVLEFNCRTPNMKSARPVLLLGYQGPTVLVKGQGTNAPISITIKDRYDRDVRAGDLAVVARGSSGTLLVGKIINISDKRTVKIKHVGSSEATSVTNVRDDQVLLLTDDLKSMLMLEKLRS